MGGWIIGGWGWGGQRLCWPPLSNYWGAGPPAPRLPPLSTPMLPVYTAKCLDFELVLSFKLKVILHIICLFVFFLNLVSYSMSYVQDV